MRKAIVKAQIDEKLKADVEKTLERFGMTSSELIRMLYAQINLHKRIPFEIKEPEILAPSEIELDELGSKIMNKYSKGFEELAK